MLKISYSGPNTGHEFIDFEDVAVGWYDSLDVRIWESIKSLYDVDESSFTVAIMQAIDDYFSGPTVCSVGGLSGVPFPNGGVRRVW